MYQIGKMPGSIDIGYIGETNFRKIEIDMKAWMKDTPDGVPCIVHIRPGETQSDAYVANTSFDTEKNILTWEITEADIGPLEGEGLMQVWLEEYDDNVVVKRGKSINVITKVTASVDDPSQTVPSAQESMLEQMASLKNQTVTAKGAAEDAQAAAEAAAEDAQAAVTNPPYISEDTGCWMVWSKTADAYVDTGISASGDPALIIDDEAGEGDTDKTFSADKLTEELGGVKNAIQGIDNSGKLLKNPVKSALMNLFDHVVFTDGNAQVYIDALKDAWKPEGTLDSIIAVFTQGSAVIYTTDSLDVLRQYLVVTGTYIKDSVEFEDEISDYTLSGTLTAGTSTITVVYGEETATFTVDVTDQSGLPSAYQRVEYIESTGTQYILFDDLIDNNASNLAKYEFDIDCECTGWNGTNATNIVVGISSDPGCWLGFNHNIEKILMGTNNGCYFTDKASDRMQYHYSFENGYGKFERNDGATITREFSKNGSQTKLCLFSCASSASNPSEYNIFRSLFKLYSFYLTREGTPKYNMIPCYRKSDNVIGLYNTVDETFYTNNGTGTFNKGSDVNV